jgi:murein DD-endopeptidase MepM/ murein hydrolase activator NlpD
MHKNLSIAIFRIILILSLSTAIAYGEEATPTPGNLSCEACRQFNLLNTAIRDRKISRNEARKQLAALLPAIKNYALQQGAGQYTRSQWVFPVAGLDVKSAGNSRGADYISAGYDFFDGNAHGGHPSFDLFIRDRNRDSLDDRSAGKVPVLSMTGGIVVAVENDWNRQSKLRGGKYIWIYDISSEALVYYAHNLDILVGIGDIVKPGDTIANVGRTGLNAIKKRSPTHLHLTYLSIKDGYPLPENIFTDLKHSRSN